MKSLLPFVALALLGGCSRASGQASSDAGASLSRNPEAPLSSFADVPPTYSARLCAYKQNAAAATRNTTRTTLSRLTALVFSRNYNTVRYAENYPCIKKSSKPKAI